MNWPVVSLLDALACAEVFVDGDWVESKDQDPEGDVRLVQLADVGDGEYIAKSDRFLTSAKARALRCTFVKAGDVMVARMPDPLGRACIFPGDSKPSVTVVDVCIIRPNTQIHDARWLMHCLNAPVCRNQIAGYATGTTRSRISRGNLGKIKIPLPPLPEQRRIAEVLDKANALRAKRRAALAQLDTLTQSIFFDLFGNPVSNPKDWPTVRFEEICERVTVGIVVKPASYYASEGVPALRSLNIKPGKIVLQDLVYLSKTDNETKLTKTKLKAGDLVLIRTGQPGTAAVVPRELNGVNAIDLLIATPLPKLTDVTFLCEFFNSAGGRDLVLSRQRGQVQKHLNVGALNQAIIPLPPIELQRKFARRVGVVENAKTAHHASLAELDALFASLQHRAFRGEL